MRLRRALLFVSALLAVTASGAAATKAAPPRGLDPSFGSRGIATVPVPANADSVEGFAVTPDGRSYVLDGSAVLAFEADGALAGDFGQGGRVTVSPANPEIKLDAEPSALAVDSQGRLLIAGSARAQASPAFEAYVIRLLPSGIRDATFGVGGEVDTDFGLPVAAGEAPSLAATAIYVDGKDRPVLGGSFGNLPCGYDPRNGPEPFVARLTTTGAIDTTFATAGHRLLRGLGSVESVAAFGGDETAVFTRPCSFGARVEEQSQRYTRLTESGATNPRADERPLGFGYGSPMVDRKGRIVDIESVPPAAEGPDALVRYLANGHVDRRFGHKGRVVLGRKLGRGGGALAVDSHGRPIVAATGDRIELRRFHPDGKLDRRFGPGGKLGAGAEIPSAISLDSAGRIYTVSVARRRGKTTVAVARFIPGP